MMCRYENGEYDKFLLKNVFQYNKIHTSSYIRGDSMPTYDYQCQSKKCQKKFTVFLSLADYEKGKVVCPKCKSKRVKQLPSIFIANTSRKS